MFNILDMWYFIFLIDVMEGWVCNVKSYKIIDKCELYHFEKCFIHFINSLTLNQSHIKEDK